MADSRGTERLNQRHLMIPYGKQHIDEDDIRAVTEVLRSDWLTQGPKVEEFEEALAGYCGARYAVAVSSGTAALHLACIVAGIKNGDEVVTTPITFVASANCILYCGGKPVFADIDNHTYNIDAAEIRKKITSNTKAVIPVHFAGLICDMEAIREIADEHDLVIIEDACHALGSQWRDSSGKWNKTGSCSHSDMVVFSFHPLKSITTGEGGMILTNNESFYQKLIRLRKHGITKNAEIMEDKSKKLWHYQQVELGFNYRITDIQAALGISQLKRIDKFILRRNELALRYNETLSDLPLILPWSTPDAYSAFHLYVIRLKLDKINKTREEVFESLHKHGIGVNVHYIPVHTQPYYQRLGFTCEPLPIAEKYYRETITLPLYPSMSDNEQDYVISVLKKVLF